MIIDRERRYIYIQSPQTGSTLIGNLLVDEYGAQRIGRKHDFLWDLSSDVAERLDSYFVFTAVREPFSQTLSALAKERRTDPDLTFSRFMDRTHQWPFIDWRAIDHDRCDSLLRLESLDRDFRHVLGALELPATDELEPFNVTRNRAEHTIDAARLMYLFGPHRAYLNERAGTDFDVDWSVLSTFQSFCSRIDYASRMWLLRGLSRAGFPPTSQLARWCERLLRTLTYPFHCFNTRRLRPSSG